MSDGFLYFVQAANGPIKIGFALDPMQRLRQLRSAHYEELNMLGVLRGTLDDEHALHLKLGGSHLRGEWFKPTDAVMAVVKTLGKAPPPRPFPRSRNISVPMERGHVERAIEHAHGNISVAATVLGCSRRTLQNRMRALNMPPGISGRPHKAVGTPINVQPNDPRMKKK